MIRRAKILSGITVAGGAGCCGENDPAVCDGYGEGGSVAKRSDVSVTEMLKEPSYFFSELLCAILVKPTVVTSRRVESDHWQCLAFCILSVNRTKKFAVVVNKMVDRIGRFS